MEYNQLMKDLKTEKEELEKVKSLCEKNELPSILFESLVEKDNKVFYKHSFYDVVKNFYIMNRYFKLIEIYEHSSFLLMEPKELYTKINVLLNNKISLDRLFSLDLYKDLNLRSEYLKMKSSNEGQVDKDEVNRYKFVYLMSKKTRANELEELEIHISNKKSEVVDEKEEKKEIRITPLYDFFPGYEREEVDYVVSRLSNSNKELLKIAFGDDFDNPKRGKLWKESYIRLNFRGLILSMAREMDRQRVVKKNPAPITFYDHFKDFSHEEVDAVLDTLDEKEYALLTKAFGEKLRKSDRSDYWNKKDSEALKKFMLDFLIRLFDNRKKGKLMSKITEGLNNEETNVEELIEEVDDILTFEDYMKGYTLIDLCNMLGEDQAKIVAMKLGLFSTKKYKEVEIAAFLNQHGGKYSSKMVYEIFNKNIELLKDKYRGYKFKTEIRRAKEL